MYVLLHLSICVVFVLYLCSICISSLATPPILQLLLPLATLDLWPATPLESVAMIIQEMVWMVIVVRVMVIGDGCDGGADGCGGNEDKDDGSLYG